MIYCSYSFDGFMPAHESEALKTQLFNSISQLNFLGFNSSLMLNGLQDINGQLDVFREILENLFKHLQKESSEGVLRLDSIIDIECYEIFADQHIRDLFAPDAAEKPKTRESDGGCVVEGLVRRQCVDAAASVGHIHEALKQQTVLVSLPIPNLTIVPNSIEEKIYAPKVVGPAAHIFVILYLKQNVYVNSIKSVVQLDSSMQVLSLSSSENLGYHSTATEAISFMTCQQFEDTFSAPSSRNSLRSRDQKHNHIAAQEVKRNLQLSSFKALSTLTRVVQLLGAKYESSTDLSKTVKAPKLKTKSNSASSGSSLELTSPLPMKRADSMNHIPFRDSLLTRLLQSTLQGNCAQFFLTVIRSEVDTQESAPSHSAMRFASSLYKLYNIISNTKKPMSFADFYNNFQENKALFSYTSPLLTDETLTALQRNDSDAIEAMDRLIFIKFGDQKRFPVKNYSDFERAMIDVKTELTEISEFCDEMSQYLVQKSRREMAVDEEIAKRRSSMNQVSSVEVLMRKIKSEEFRGRSASTGQQPTTLPALQAAASSPSLNEVMSSPPKLKRTSSNSSMKGSKGKRFSLTIQQVVEPSSSTITRDNRTNVSRMSPPQQRTSLPDLSQYLLKNGVSDFQDKVALPSISNPPKRRLSVDKGIRKAKSSPVDSSLASASTEKDAPQAVRIYRKATVEVDDEGELRESEKFFFRSVSTGGVAAVEEALLNGVDINVKNSFGRDAMQVAARNGSLEVLKKLYDLGGNLFTKGPEGENLFHIGCSNGHINVLVWLLEQGADPALSTPAGQTAAHIAARRGELQVVKFLHFICNLDFAQLDDEGKTPVQCIPRCGPDNIAETKQFINMVTAPPETKELYKFVLEREMASLKRYLSKAGLIVINPGVSEAGSPTRS
jgi:hypothetical protein